MFVECSVKVTDRSEALAHQRLATNLLAQRTLQLETRLSRSVNDVDVDSPISDTQTVTSFDSDIDDNVRAQSPADSSVDAYLSAVESI